MGMAGTLRDYLDRHAIAYELLRHSRTRTSSETAEAAHVSGDRLAKPVVIEDDDRYLVVVIPASQRIDFTALHRAFGRQFGLATASCNSPSSLRARCPLPSRPTRCGSAKSC